MRFKIIFDTKKDTSFFVFNSNFISYKGIFEYFDNFPYNLIV